MTSVVRFLQARIDEDEAAADRGWSPDRVRAECRAKRALLAVLTADGDADWDWLDEGSALSWLFGGSDSGGVERKALDAMARVYARHPGHGRRRPRPGWPHG